ncbi:MAG: hypothetical protein GEV10_06650 [Streptosporangiales bacterium]|nr:hypothetical protein [Streptosporangiales bacterium]
MRVESERFDPDLLDDEDPFEIDSQAAHLFKLVVPLAPARSRDPRRCRPIGCYEAAPGLASQYRRDR